jgi:hypothetical protein
MVGIDEQKVRGTAATYTLGSHCSVRLVEFSYCFRVTVIAYIGLGKGALVPATDVALVLYLAQAVWRSRWTGGE